MTQHHAPTSAIVIRHGESEWNVLGKWQGRADTQLTPAGRAQARAAAERLLVDGVSIDTIKDGVVLDGFDAWDSLGFREQLGIIKPL